MITFKITEVGISMIKVITAARVIKIEMKTILASADADSCALRTYVQYDCSH